jgi:hypothetical protein
MRGHTSVRRTSHHVRSYSRKSAEFDACFRNIVNYTGQRITGMPLLSYNTMLDEYNKLAAY